MLYTVSTKGGTLVSVAQTPTPRNTLFISVAGELTVNLAIEATPAK
jgi:hypothetical protein